MNPPTTGGHLSLTTDVGDNLSRRGFVVSPRNADPDVQIRPPAVAVPVIEPFLTWPVPDRASEVRPHGAGRTRAGQATATSRP